jgi:hypothetical protein
MAMAVKPRIELSFSNAKRKGVEFTSNLLGNMMTTIAD